MAVTSERGQMLLIGALVLAVLFISLSFVLDGSIQTTTVSGEASADVSVSETVALQNSIRRDVGEIIERAKDEHPATLSGPCPSQECAVKRNISVLSGQYQLYYARHDRIVDLTFDSSIIGRSYQQNTGDFTDEDGDTNPELASDSHIKRFDIMVDGAGLPDVSDPPFRVLITGDSHSWTIELYDNGGPSVDVIGPNGSNTCSGSGTTMFNFANGTLDGTECEYLDVLERGGPRFDVEYENADAINGGYELVASSPGSDDFDEADPVLYGVFFELTERSPTVDYETTIRVAPGEP